MSSFKVSTAFSSAANIASVTTEAVNALVLATLRSWPAPMLITACDSFVNKLKDALTRASTGRLFWVHNFANEHRELLWMDPAPAAFNVGRLRTQNINLYQV